jgi:hypothetical protein
MIGRMVERWGLVFGTWLLAVATIWLAWDAKWSSKEQLRAYLYVNPGELYHIDGKGVLQVRSASFFILKVLQMLPRTSIVRSQEGPRETSL